MEYQRVFIGLTGGIGSGKSTVSKMLADKGIAIVDADKISRALTHANGLAIPAIREVFGDEVITEDNALNRAVMRGIVFSRPEAKKTLEGIMHPLIREQMIGQALLAQESPYIVFDIPLLIESVNRYRSWLTRICVVDCEEETQIARVQARNGLSREEVLHILRNQATREERKRYADDMINNGNMINLSMLAEQVNHLHHQWLALHTA